MVKIGDKIIMRESANEMYCYTVAGTTGIVTGVDGNFVDVTFDYPLDSNYTVDIRHVKVIKESAMFNHNTARQGKIGAIKALRAFVPGLALGDAKDIVESIGANYDCAQETTELLARVTKLETELNAMRAAYNDLLSYVPTDRLIDLLRK